MGIAWKSAGPVASVVRMKLPDHVGHLCRIERECHDEPWTLEDWRKATAAPGVGGRVATVDGRIVGYVLFRVAARTAHVFNMGVETASRRTGVGRSLLASLVESPASMLADCLQGGRLVGNRVPRVLSILCHEELLNFQLFLRACNVPVVRVDRGAFGDRDAYIFEVSCRAKD